MRRALETGNSGKALRLARNNESMTEPRQRSRFALIVHHTDERGTGNGISYFYIRTRWLML